MSSTVLNYGLMATATTESIQITGRTFDSKDRLKALGATWNAEKKVWVLPLGTDMSSLAYVSPPPREKKKRVPPPQPTTRYLSGDRLHVCVKKVARINPSRPDGPMMYVCDCHPTFYSSYDGT